MMHGFVFGAGVCGFGCDIAGNYRLQLVGVVAPPLARQKQSGQTLFQRATISHAKSRPTRGGRQVVVSPASG